MDFWNGWNNNEQYIIGWAQQTVQGPKQWQHDSDNPFNYIGKRCCKSAITDVEQFDIHTKE